MSVTTPYQWFVFSTRPEDAEDSLAGFATYADAVFQAQCNHDTNNRPTRIYAGCYRVEGYTGRASYVTSRKVAKEEFNLEV